MAIRSTVPLRRSYQPPDEPSTRSISSRAARGRLTLPWRMHRHAPFPHSRPSPRSRNAGESRGSGLLVRPATRFTRSVNRGSFYACLSSKTRHCLCEFMPTLSSSHRFAVAGQPLLGCCPRDGKRGCRKPFPRQTLAKYPQAMAASPKVGRFANEFRFRGRRRDSIRPTALMQVNPRTRTIWLENSRFGPQAVTRQMGGTRRPGMAIAAQASPDDLIRRTNIQ